MKLSVLGAGAWGTALAIHASRRPGNAVRLWARDAQQAAEMQASRCNRRYLPAVGLPPALQVDSDLDAALSHAAGGLVVVATPMAGLEPLLRRLQGGAYEGDVVWLSKGLQQGTGRLGHEIAAAVAPGCVSACCRGRASRSKWLATSRPHWLRRATTRHSPRTSSRRCTTTACASTPRPIRSVSKSAVR